MNVFRPHMARRIVGSIAEIKAAVEFITAGLKPRLVLAARKRSPMKGRIAKEAASAAGALDGDPEISVHWRAVDCRDRVPESQ